MEEDQLYRDDPSQSQADEEDAGGENDDWGNGAQTYLSVAQDGAKLSFCAYNEDQNEILYETIIQSEGVTIERIVAAVRPTLLLLPSKVSADSTLLQFLTSPLPELPQVENQEDDDDNGSGVGNEAPNDGRDQNAGARPPQQLRREPRSIPYRLMKTSSYDIRNCKALILQRLQVRSLVRQGRPGLRDMHQRHFPGAANNNSAPSRQISNYHALASVVDFESSVQVQAIGSLLSFMSTAVFRLDKQGDGRMVINDMRPLNARLYMHVPASTLSALHIFKREHHPLAAAKGSNNTKEGFSLFSLLDRTKSRAGRQRLREWMLQPLLDVDAIRRRQDGVQLFLQPETQHINGEILSLLSQVAALEPILARVQKCAAKPTDYVALLRSLAAGMSICESLRSTILYDLQQACAGPDGQPSQESANPVLLRFIDYCTSILDKCHVHELYELHERIANTIDDAVIAECGSMVIRTGFSESLDLQKQQYESLNDMMADVCAQLAEQYPSLESYMSITFMPQVGFLVVLPVSQRWAEEGALPEDFRFIFSENNLNTYKNDTCRMLDESIGDLDGAIKDAENLIVAELEDDILDKEMEVRETFTALAELDCILAFAAWASDIKCVRPEVVPAEEYCIEIRQGRHPLQELILETEFVANDTFVDTDMRVNVITGPNFSGKSCYARQVGILVYMSHIGSFIPCDEARISLTDQIFAQFSAVETCSVPQSSFQLDLSSMGAILRKAGPNTLVLIDEFGKGTSPASGIALLTAALKKFSVSRTKVMCTTHFLEILSMGLINDEQEGFSALRMAVQTPTNPDASALPLFRLERGVASSSAGLVCAKMAGVKKSIIERAAEIIQAVKDRQQVEPLHEILRGKLSLTKQSETTLQTFAHTDWEKAADQKVEQFLHMAAQL